MTSSAQIRQCLKRTETTGKLTTVGLSLLLLIATTANGVRAVESSSNKTVNLNAPPISGELFSLDGKVDLSRLITLDSSVSLDKSDDAPALKVKFSKAKYPKITFPCPVGGWNLQAFNGVEVELTNISDKSVRAGLRVDNIGAEKDKPWNTEMKGIGPGETETIQLVFGEDNGAPTFPLDPTRVVDIQVFLEKPKQPSTLLVRNLKGYGSSEKGGTRSAFSKIEDRNNPVTPPDWLGKRPPIKGDWIMTLNETFDGDQLNTELWTPRLLWDGPAKAESQRYIEENVTVKDGIMSIKCDINPGHQYNDPKLPTRKYATGAVTSFDKWTQRYGYIEARLKPPIARGLWPAFWTMPDRGAETGLNVWERRDTKNKHGRGMEIDIFEHLTEWGPGRTNIAAHWGGYGSGHQRWGTNHVYYGPTADGWHVFGILWEPNKLTWYIDGVKKGEWESDQIGDVPSYLKFTVQMGNWATKDVDDAILPDYFQVDYVRAWQTAERIEKESAETS